MSDKVRQWGITSYTDRFKLIHIDSSEHEDLLEGHIDDDDASLIVAAPDLLEALELALASHGVFLASYPAQDAWVSRGVETKARAAIAKAKGE